MYDPAYDPPPVAWLRIHDISNSVRMSHHKSSFVPIPTQHGSVPLTYTNPLGKGKYIYLFNVTKTAPSTPKTSDCCETLCAGIAKERHVRHMLTVAIHAMSHSVHRSDEESLVSSISCCRPALLLVWSCNPIAEHVPTSNICHFVRANYVSLLCPIRRWDGEAFSIPY